MRPTSPFWFNIKNKRAFLILFQHQKRVCFDFFSTPKINPFSISTPTKRLLSIKPFQIISPEVEYLPGGPAGPENK
jgi:hypothetical protein